ncbi:SAM-dependent methyltransferase [Sphingomonas elodea]|uniref:SAM-dependent methyltransferase n=1 Tax=Sphingomonas elodea TaxID=179878 RepID=UPI0002631084|nr:methyltransferase domain-containing protein [Sphingomonas elodea]
MSIRNKIQSSILNRLLSMVNEQSQPNLNALNDIVKEVRVLELNMKAFGYDLARKMAAALPPTVDRGPQVIGLQSKGCTQSDMESDWVAHWAHAIGTPMIYHRKLWEFAYVLQALFEGGHLQPGQRGLGFGCGAEPIPSYLAAQGVGVTATDFSQEEAIESGWVDTNQHLGSAAVPFIPHLVTKEVFERFVEIDTVDMNAIPDRLKGFDFCWSICALEHLGSIERGLAFIERSLDTLRPGGTAVHTLEFNVEADGPTVDNWVTVLFQQRHLEAMAARLDRAGHRVAPLDFSTGAGVLDGFIDMPPWHDARTQGGAAGLGEPSHLKLSIDGFVCTSFGIVVRKGA